MSQENEEIVLTLQEANVLELSDLDVAALDAQVEEVWETVERMQEAQTVTKETLTAEISV